jgi:hypothetical protein
MRSTSRGTLSALVTGGALLTFVPTVSAQVGGAMGALGGFGARSSGMSSGMGANRSMVIPYGGMYEGFMPSRMGGGSSLSFQARPSMPLGSSQMPFRLSPISGGMGARLGLRPAMGSKAPGMGVMPRSLGYPFRQPPSLIPSSGSTSGMSM